VLVPAALNQSAIGMKIWPTHRLLLNAYFSWPRGVRLNLMKIKGRYILGAFVCLIIVLGIKDYLFDRYSEEQAIEYFTKNKELVKNLSRVSYWLNKRYKSKYPSYSIFTQRNPEELRLFTNGKWNTIENRSVGAVTSDLYLFMNKHRIQNIYGNENGIILYEFSIRDHDLNWLTIVSTEAELSHSDYEGFWLHEMIPNVYLTNKN
jgi:hypothetical protein